MTKQCSMFESIAIKSEKAITTAVKDISESDSILLQVDEETGRILQTISDSISSEILEKLEEKLKSSNSSDKINDSMEVDLKKISKRVDEIVDQLEELSDKVDKMNQNYVKLLRVIDPYGKLEGKNESELCKLNAKEGKE